MLKTDQHLFYERQELCDDDATLELLGIPQGAQLLLKVGSLTGCTVIFEGQLECCVMKVICKCLYKLV